jgi:hypothetical protein
MRAACLSGWSHRALILYVHVEHVGVRPAKRDAQAALLELIGHRLGILDGLRLQSLELAGAGQLEGQGEGCEDVDMRTALLAGENGLVQLPGDIREGSEQNSAAEPSRDLWVVDMVT